MVLSMNLNEPISTSD